MSLNTQPAPSEAADPRRWRALTVTQLAGFMSLLDVRHVGGDAAAWAAAGPLLLGGLGGGMVTSPNITLTLESVPVRMAGVAGGALQTGQRIGSAIGTATLAGVFYMVLGSTGRDYPAAVSAALLCAAGIMLLALLLAVAELVRRRPLAERAPATSRPEHHLHQL